MASEYVNISQQEMEAFLKPMGFVQIQIPGTIELVYAKIVRIGKVALSLRVNTGINPDGKSRTVGDDAIRPQLFIAVKDGEKDGKPYYRPHYVAGCKRVHRVKGWKTNLTERLNNWTQAVQVCPCCGLPMVIRENKAKKTKFWGCIGYVIKDQAGNPSCRQTINIDPPKAKQKQSDNQAEGEIQAWEGGQE